MTQLKTDFEIEKGKGKFNVPGDSSTKCYGK